MDHRGTLTLRKKLEDHFQFTVCILLGQKNNIKGLKNEVCQ